MIQLTEQNRQDLITWLRAWATGRGLKALENLKHVDAQPVPEGMVLVSVAQLKTWGVGAETIAMLEAAEENPRTSRM